MSYFKSSEEWGKVLVGFFEDLLKNPEVGPKLRAAKLKIKFIYKDPDLIAGIDLDQGTIQILPEDNEFKADVQMTMKTDVAHRFWHGKVNLIAALTRREMVAKGPIPKILKLLPAIKPAYALYPEFLKKLGMDSIVIQ